MRFRRIFCALLVLLIMCTVFPVSFASADDNGFDEFDFVILLDSSNSMRNTDPNEVSQEAAKMFIDACELSGSRVSIIKFHSLIKASQFYPLDTMHSRNMAKAQLDDVERKSGSLVGSALLKAANLLQENANPGRKKFILLLSDGGVNVDNQSELNEAIEICEAEDIPVYIVGAANAGWVGTDEELLMNLANRTGGDFLLATDIQQVPEFFRDIFGALRNTSIIDGESWVADGNYHVVNVDVTDRFMSYADVNVSTGAELQDVYIVDPNGQRVDFDDENFILSPSRLYTYIRLVEPEIGQWKVYIKGATRDNIHVSYIVNYAVKVTPVVSRNDFSVASPGKVGARIIIKGQQEADQAFYEFMTASYVWVIGADSEELVELHYDPEMGCLAAEYLPAGIGSYTVSSAYVECPYFQRTSEEEVGFTVLNSPPVCTGTLADQVLDIASEDDDSSIVYFDGIFSDPNNDELTYSARTERGINARVDADKHSVTIEGKHVTEGAVTLVAKDPSGEEATCTIKVTVNDSARVRKIIIRSGAAVTLLVLLVWFILSRRKVKGYLSVLLEGSGNRGPANVNLNKKGTPKSMSLRKLLNLFYQEYVNTYAFSVPPRNEEALRAVAAIDKVQVLGTIGSKKQLTVDFGKSGEEIYVNGIPGAAAGKCRLSPGQSLTITFTENDLVLILSYTDKLAVENSFADTGF